MVSWYRVESSLSLRAWVYTLPVRPGEDQERMIDDMCFLILAAAELNCYLSKIEVFR